ncbi:FecR family protein [Dysgonomonas sp. 511]|uniref:FecR family protein n=1 Tax=Dysgonomonas sp. 511 TaxID=2302930 RepID=UPI0013D758B0|nr:FecR family protein [Dysgonomonas sp. 511]NDV79308.1 FecR family protein [Dysgonomonas sp. 511]
MMDDKYIDKIIELYSKTKAEGATKDEFHEWLIDEEFSEEKEDALFRLWEQDNNASTEDSLPSFVALQEKVIQRKKKTKILLWKSAAAVAIILIISSIFFLPRSKSTDISFNEYFTQTGQTETMILPDGSAAQINSKSLIIYPDHFGKEARTIYLSGEANFDVQKNEKVPFIVKSAGISITALGTEFNVCAYPEDAYIKVTLINGSVKVVQASGLEHTLLPGHQLIYDKHTGKHNVRDVDIHEITAWQRNELLFRGVTINEILNVLERNYKVSFQYENSAFDNDKYNFKFKKEASITDIMNIIKEVADFEYKKDGDLYCISPKRK